eukprot:CAMPEP_0175844984 /NCGR_PEP_ID=MMETSP0107_2-20121207/21957_1 /TAXON_ID=195067 ORGANISM="Goniomonas pacifica, Strain CCMP1869" /NCGR_SAMPLE_ID=MMETSP0107_2 /ASSEMBLY_ACC=CAM_ASM_000203 /LENGTH=150 /DNA_ID=CAMNT_0017159461 /DNA_START=240 /DNA_END=692 /DNA_ORIENTATION=-
MAGDLNSYTAIQKANLKTQLKNAITSATTGVESADQIYNLTLSSGSIIASFSLLRSSVSSSVTPATLTSNLESASTSGVLAEAVTSSASLTSEKIQVGSSAPVTVVQPTPAPSPPPASPGTVGAAPCSPRPFITIALFVCVVLLSLLGCE